VVHHAAEPTGTVSLLRLAGQADARVDKQEKPLT
jgi:hypothetical protein